MLFGLYREYVGDIVTNLELLDRAESTCIESILILRWVGHVFRMQ